MAGKMMTWLVVLSAILLSGHAASAEPSRSAAELEQLRRSIEQLQQQLASERVEEKSIVGEWEKLERQLTELIGQRQTKMVELQRIKNRKMQLEQQQRELEKQRRESRDDLTKLARASYLLGRQSGLKLILNQQNPAQTARSLAIFRYLSDARKRRILAAQKLRHELLATGIELEQRHQQLDSLLELLARNQTQLDAKRAQRERSLAAIREQMRENREQVGLYQQRERELEQLLARLRRQSLSQPSDRQPSTAVPTEIALGGFQQYKGNLGAPVRGKIAARFGQRKPESGLRWQGLMFEAAEGEPVMAIYPGQVVFADWFRGYGQLMVLDHGDGYMSLYGHNRLLRVGLGASVKAGEGIGEAGSTGGIARSGLYFEIRHNGEPRDPLEWCRM